MRAAPPLATKGRYIDFLGQRGGGGGGASRGVALGPSGQHEGGAGLPQGRLHLAVELLPVLVELHDALGLGRHPELVELVGQITYGGGVRG